MRFLGAEQVVRLHGALLDRWGGDAGGGHRGTSFEGVDAAVQAVKNSYYDTAYELAAAYAVYIVQGHVFLDGNKRAGSAAMLVFLAANGIEVSLPPLQVARRMVELQKRSERGDSATALISWLAGWLAAPARRRRGRGERR